MSTSRVYVCRPGRKDGACWVLKVKPPRGQKGRRFSSGTENYDEAVQIAAAEEAALNAGLTGRPATVGDVLARFELHAEATMRPSTIKSVRCVFKRLEPIGSVALEALSPRHVKQIRDSLAQRLDGKTVNGTIWKARRAFRWANEEELTAVSWPVVRPAKAKRTKKQPYTAAECRKILWWFEAYLDGRYAPALHALLESGARAGEVLSLRGRDLRRDESLIYFGETKTGEPRWSGVRPKTMARLPRVGPDEWVFPSAVFKGKHVAVNTINLLLQQARKELGIYGPLDLHSLRRTHTTEAEAAEVPERLAMKQQGHRSVQQHRAYKDRARGDDLVAEATAVAARWDPSPTVPDPSPESTNSATNSGQDDHSQWSNRDWESQAHATGRLGLPPVVHHQEVSGRRAPAHPVVAGMVLGLPDDEWAPEIGELVQFNPPAMAALLSDASRVLTVMSVLREAGYLGAAPSGAQERQA